MYQRCFFHSLVVVVATESSRNYKVINHDQENINRRKKSKQQKKDLF